MFPKNSGDRPSEGWKRSFAACSTSVLLMETFRLPAENLADYPTLFNIPGCTLILIENAGGRRRAASSIKTLATADNFSYPPLQISSPSNPDFLPLSPITRHRSPRLGAARGLGTLAKGSREIVKESRPFNHASRRSSVMSTRETRFGSRKSLLYQVIP